MRFELHREAADGEDEALTRLDVLLGRVEEDVHELVFAHPEEIEQTRWFSQLPRYRRDLVQKLLGAQVWLGTRRVVPVRSPSDVRPARDAAVTPLPILVEDDASDGALLSAAVLAHADEATLRTWEAGARANPRGWVFVHCGGSSIKRKTREYAEDSRTTGRRPLVVVDSDEELPAPLRAQEPSIRRSPSRDLKEEADRHGVRLLILPLREAENYLPDAFWAAWADESPQRSAYRPVVKALAQLSADQRDFLDMEGDKRLSASPDRGPLFDGSDQANPRPSEAVVAALSGKKKNLKKASWNPDTRERTYTIRLLPDFLRAGKVTAADLVVRDRVGALRTFVHMLSEEL